MTSSLYLLWVSLSASSGHGNTDILQEIMSELVGTSFTCQDPDDGIVAIYIVINVEISHIWRVVCNDYFNILSFSFSSVLLQCNENSKSVFYLSYDVLEWSLDKYNQPYFF